MENEGKKGKTLAQVIADTGIPANNFALDPTVMRNAFEAAEEQRVESLRRKANEEMWETVPWRKRLVELEVELAMLRKYEEINDRTVHDLPDPTHLDELYPETAFGQWAKRMYLAELNRIHERLLLEESQPPIRHALEDESRY
jgi:hypothetical protein